MTRLSSRRSALPGIALGLVAVLMTAAALPRGDEPATLHDAMEGVKDGLKTIASSIQAPGNDEDALDGCQRMEHYLLLAKAMQPPKLPTIKESDVAAHTVAFRADIARALQMVLDLEIAVLEGRLEDAQTMIRGKLFPFREASHDKYQPEDERREEREQQRNSGGRTR